MNTSFFADLLQSIAERGRTLIARTARREAPKAQSETLIDHCEALLSGRGEASGTALATDILAQYSALKVVEKKYGMDMVRKALRRELDRYLRGRAGEIRHEPPIVLVQREPYVWYNKGSLVMYALADYIGEDQLNLGLRNFLMANRYAKGPFPDTRGFVAALRSVTPYVTSPPITHGAPGSVTHS